MYSGSSIPFRVHKYAYTDLKILLGPGGDSHWEESDPPRVQFKAQAGAGTLAERIGTRLSRLGSLLHTNGELQENRKKQFALPQQSILYTLHTTKVSFARPCRSMVAGWGGWRNRMGISALTI